MKKNLKICAIIPARSGSIRIANKNLLKINNKPLIKYTFDEVIKSKFIKRIFCTTDDKNIIALKGINKKIEFPFSRPKNISRKNTSTENVVVHLLNFLKKKKRYVPDLIVLLQPTSPLRKVRLIDSAIKIFINKNYESLISVKKIKFRIFEKKSNSLKFVNKIKQVYRSNGAIYISKTNYFMKNKSFVSKKILPFFMNEKTSLDIDTFRDLKRFKDYINEK